jgi:hypothetical protein
MTTSTHSNFVLEEIFSDNYNTDSKLLSKSQDKLLSKQRTNTQKDNNEKT